MIKHIRNASGICKQAIGNVVDAEKKGNLWHFELFGEKWVASDYAFEEEKNERAN